MNKFKMRQLKIYPKYQRTSQWRAKFVPEIKLCGEWLKDLGFDYGEHIMVKFENDKLIIEPVGELRKSSQLRIWKD
ncbi:SymE family type I addiction module toxin [Dyadobacter luticola]|uniref:Type I toxin-antitoxin system SymE family toxin n=1 Tax=Dyadobacter luticola TaxID=1979387 RepID=A0A5R9KXC0_9BACT|nr:SymE family type I addiction module toxin [Dyadobacter luticola]TLV00913.1 type I toxin-antitoxin system SymE family toxin [Dyadobacter luticola]